MKVGRITIAYWTVVLVAAALLAGSLTGLTLVLLVDKVFLT